MAKHDTGAKADHETRILDAASAILLENGFDSTVTAEIAKLARVSKRELYGCFSGKRAILAAVIERLQREIHSQVNVSWHLNADLRTVLTRAGTEILNFVNSEKFGKLFRIVASETFRDPVSAEKFYLLGPGMGRASTGAFIKRQMAAGHLRRYDPLRAADDFLDLIISARHLTAVVLGQEHDIPPTRKHVRHAVDMFLSFYASPAPAKRPADRLANKARGGRGAGAARS